MSLQNAWDNRIRHHHDAAIAGRQTSQPHAWQAHVAQRGVQVSTALVCLWSLIEMPWEWTPADDPTRVAALLTSKFVLLGLGAAAIWGVRYARTVFITLCAASVLGLALTLSPLYAISHMIFSLTLFECVLKTAVVVTGVTWYLTRNAEKKAR